MKISKDDLDWAASKGLISPEQAENLWKVFESRSATTSKFDLAHVAYYLGALIVISAMGWFMTLAWERFGGGGIFAISVAYALCFILAGRTLWCNENLKVPGGLLFTMAVGMTPLAIYGLERLAGIWPQGDPGVYRDYHIWVKGSWLLIELGTIVAGLIALRCIRFPFLTAPIAFSLWYMSMDLTPLLFGKTDFSFEERLQVSLWFGLAMLVASYFVDRKTKEDYAFWGYLFGMLAFWGGLSLMESGSELRKFAYCLINVGLMILSVVLQRRAFIVFGALGVFGYLGHLSYRVFKDSLMFPFALSLLGIVIIYLGITYQRNREAIERAIAGLIPQSLAGRAALGVLGVLLLFAGVEPHSPTTTKAPATATPTSPNFRVVEVTLRADPFNYVGPCPVAIKFSGRISAVGGSGRISYKFLRSDGASAPIETLTFDTPASKDVSTTWTLGAPGTYSGWQAIQIFDPQELKSNQAPFTIKCQ
jgi:hypothetical protein